MPEGDLEIKKVKKRAVALAVVFALFAFASRVEAQVRSQCGPLNHVNSCVKNWQCTSDAGWQPETFQPEGTPCNLTVNGSPGVCHLTGIPAKGGIAECVVQTTNYRINVTVSGLRGGTLTLLNNASASSRLSIMANGSYVFPIPLADSASYAVTVQAQPAWQSCSMVGSSGKIHGANANVIVTCIEALSTSSWTPVGPAPVANSGPGQGGNAGRVNVAVADLTNPAVIYLGASGGGIWKTSNAQPGMTPTWQPLTDNIPAPLAAPSDQASLQVGEPHSLSVHPINHNLIQAAVYYSGGGILRSSQAGLPGTWSLMGNSLFDHSGMSAIAVHPTHTQTAYAATDKGLYRTVGGGQHWTLVAGGLPTTGVSDVIFARFDPAGNTLFVSVFGNSGSSANLNGLYRSTDGGVTWTLLPGLPNAALSGQYRDSTGYLQTVSGNIAMDSGSDKALYVAIRPVGNDPNHPGALTTTAFQRFKSLDGGTTWTELSPPASTHPQTCERYAFIAVDPQNDNHVFARDDAYTNCGYTLYESTDGGATWAQPPGTPGYDWVSVSFDANGKVLATADQGLFRYDPKATTNNWESLNGNLQITTFYTITLAGQSIAGTAQDQYFALIAPEDQHSAVWQSIGAGSENGKILLPRGGANYAYAYNPLDGNYNLVWRTQTPQTTLQPSTQWTPIFTKNIYGTGNGYTLAYASQNAFVMDPYNQRRLLVGADQVYETTNADSMSPPPTWSPIGPPAPAGEQPYVTTIAIAPSASNCIYVATTDQRVWVTVDGGTKWTENDNGLYNPNNPALIGAVVAVSIDPRNPQHAFAVTSQWWGTSQVWELGPPSPSGQQTWVSRSGPGNLTVYGIFVDWQYATPKLYIGADRGVYNSNDLGRTWIPFGAGLPNARVFDIQAAPATTSPRTSVLAAATYGRGVFEILLAEPPAPPSSRIRPSAPPRTQAKLNFISPKRAPWGEGQQLTAVPQSPAPPPKP